MVILKQAGTRRRASDAACSGMCSGLMTMTVACYNHCELIGPVNRRRESSGGPPSRSVTTGDAELASVKVGAVRGGNMIVGGLLPGRT